MSSSRFACPRLETDREWKEPTVLTLNNWALVLDILRNIGSILGWVNQGRLSGTSILDRNGFSDIKPDSSHFEQAFSDDGGKNWIMTFTR
jgi:hypothetical protein